MSTSAKVSATRTAKKNLKASRLNDGLHQDERQLPAATEPEASMQPDEALPENLMLASAEESVPTAAVSDASADAGSALAAGLSDTTAAELGTINPLWVGAGVLGATVLMAGSSGGSHGSGAHDQLQNNLNKPDGQKEQGQQKPATPNDQTPESQSPRTDDGEPRTGLAQAQGPDDKPSVAADGNTRLKAESFTLPLQDGKAAEFVQIQHIFTRHGDDKSTSRLVRYGDNDGNSNDAQSVHSRIALKAPGDEAASTADTTQTAYEVIVPRGGPVTLAEARTMAETLGGKLLVVNDQREADWLQNAFKNQLHDHRAWIDSNAVQAGNTVQRTGQIGENGNTDALKLSYSSETDAALKLPAFVIEYANYQHPLMLLKGGKLTPVTEGQIIAKADLGNLVWNGNSSSSAEIRIRAMDSSDPATARPLQQDGKPIERTLPLTEDPSIKAPAGNAGQGEPGAEQGQGQGQDQGEHGHHGDHEGHGHDHGHQPDGNHQPPASGANPGSGSQSDPAGTTLPTYDASARHTARVAHNQAAADLEDAIFFGKDPNKAPDFILIHDITPGKAGNSAVLSYTNPGGNKHIPNEQPGDGYLLSKDEYKTLSWNTALSDGGSFQFTPGDAHGKPLPGATAQTVEVQELPAPSNSQDSGSEPPAPTVPTYGKAETVQVANNAESTKVGEAIFRGNNARVPAKFIKILGITQEGDAQQAVPEDVVKTGLLKNGSEALKVGDVVADTDFDKITWDASKIEGGRFSFKPVADKSGTDIQGFQGSGQSVHILEHPVAPTYEAQNLTLPVAHNAASTPLDSKLLGTANPAKWIRIISVNGETDQHARDIPLKLAGNSVKPGTTLPASDVSKLVWDATTTDGGRIVFQAMVVDQATGAHPILGSQQQTLIINEQPPAPPTYDNSDTLGVTYNQADFRIPSERILGTGTPATHVKILAINGERTENNTPSKLLKLGADGAGVEIGQVLTAEQVKTLLWDASAAGTLLGSIQFKPVLPDGKDFPGTDEQQIAIQEREPAKPTYASDAALSATYNQASLEIPAGRVLGTGEPARYVKITEINGINTAETVSTSLKLGAGGTGVKVGQVLSAKEAETLTWDATHQHGGNFKFIPLLEADGTQYSGGSTAQTITINETPYTPAVSKLEVQHNKVTPIGSQIFGLETGSPKPGFIKITTISTNPDAISAQHEGTKTLYTVVKAGQEGIELEAAKQKAQEMGGKLLEITNETEAGWLKTHLIGKLDFSADQVNSDVTKGAWFTNPESAPLAEGAENQEGIIAGGAGNNDFQFVDLQAGSLNHTKLSAYVVEFSNYDTTKPALVLGTEQTGNKPVIVGQDSAIIANDQLGKLSWDSMFNSGGFIRFIEVTDGTGRTNAPEAKVGNIEITESSAPAPASVSPASATVAPAERTVSSLVSADSKLEDLLSAQPGTHGF